MRTKPKPTPKLRDNREVFLMVRTTDAERDWVRAWARRLGYKTMSEMVWDSLQRRVDSAS